MKFLIKENIYINFNFYYIKKNYSSEKMQIQTGKRKSSKKIWKTNEWKEENMTVKKKEDKWKLKISMLAVKTVILMTE